MDFSGKITNSVILFLKLKGVSTAALYEMTDLPPEQLCDPSTWLPAAKVEQFLESLEKKYHHLTPDSVFINEVGHQAKELRGWGALDSVLRMIEKTEDLYLQPQRFLSYFISPSPPIASLTRNESSVDFDLPIAWEEFPHVNSYLKACFEALPLFTGKTMSEVKWEQNHISIQWCSRQSTFGVTEISDRKMAPEFVDSLISTLEKTEQALIERTRELEKIRQENERASQSESTELEKWFHLYRNFNRYSQQIMKLQDFFTRSQQLVTLLVGQDRQTPQVKEAMKRIGWDSIQSTFPEITNSLIHEFENEKKSLNPENLHVKNTENKRPRNSGQSWFANS